MQEMYNIKIELRNNFAFILNFVSLLALLAFDMDNYIYFQTKMHLTN